MLNTQDSYKLKIERNGKYMEKEIISNEDIVLVGMDEVSISTEETPIIGTTSLFPCVGFLLYNKKNKKALVGHASSNWQKLIPELLALLCINDLITEDMYINCYEIFTFYLKNIIDNPTANQRFIDDITPYINHLPELSEEDKIEYTIIPGAIENQSNVDGNLKLVFEAFHPVLTKSKEPLKISDYRLGHIDKELYYKEFFFDASTGKYVTDRVLLDFEHSPKTK